MENKKKEESNILNVLSEILNIVLRKMDYLQTIQFINLLKIA